LKNHGIPSDTVATVFKASAEFFARPQDEKDALAWYSAKANRGYTAHGREKVTQLEDKGDVEALRAAVPDLKESLEIGRDDEDGCPNMWPSQESQSAKQFKKLMMDFHGQCKNLHIEVMRAVAAGLGIEKSWFDEYTSRGDNTLRLLHYPPVKKEVFDKNKNQVRAGEHSDYGSITLLFQDSRGGLQVKSPMGTFVNATPIPDTIVVNAGDLLARWANDTIKSTNHRVVEPPLPPGPDMHDTYPARYSVAYFCNPNFDKTIDVIPHTIKAGQDKRYEPVNSGDYLVRRLEATY
jgi:isopenicillin N synthase-like dioxygenase